MRRSIGALLVVGGLGATVGLSAYAADAAFEPAPPGAVAAPTLTARQVAAAEEAVQQSDALSKLSGGHEFRIESTGAWTTVGKLSGAALMIDFGEPVQLGGTWPTMTVANAVSEAEHARGVPDPATLDIRFTQPERSATASELSVLVDLDGTIKDISTVPPRAPSTIAPGPKVETPPTMP